MTAQEEQVGTHLVQTIRAHLKQRRWNVEQLADFAGVHPSGIYAVLAGDRLPSLRWLVRIADALGCEARDLLP